jgi:hypothetical protein
MKHVIYRNYNYFLIVIIALLFRILGFYFPFWGLEYEDSYIYSAVSRQINLNYSFTEDSLFTKYIIFGDLKSGILTQTISGHFIFFPAILAVINLIFGYNTFNIIILNTLLSIINIIFASKLFNLLVKNRTSQLFFSLLYASTPFLCLYNTSGLSETISSVFVVITLYFYIRKNVEKNTSNYNIIYLLFIFLSIVIKRDNLVLIALPFIDLIKYLFSSRIDLKKKFISLVLVIITVIVVFFILKVDKTIIDEKADINNISPFSLSYFYTLFPVFIKSLFNMRFFGQFSIIMIGSVFFIKKVKPNTIILLFISFSYLLIYTFHYRSYYMVNGNFIPNIIDTFRYYTNFFSILMIAFSITFFNELDNILLKYKKLITTIIISCLILNFYYNYEIRDELSAIEYNERIKPVVESLKLITKDDIIVTDRSVLFQMFGKEDIFIVDITAIGMDEIKTLNVLKNSKRIYYMKDEELDKRYSIKNYFEQNNKFTFKKRLSTHYVLLETN